MIYISELFYDLFTLMSLRILSFFFISYVLNKTLFTSIEENSPKTILQLQNF